MPKKNQLLQTPPYPVEQRLKRLGNDLRTARVRRHFTRADMAAKIGTGVRAVADAEKGKVSTSMGVYMALLWALDLLEHMENVADPTQDVVGQRLALSHEKTRARISMDLDNDF